MLARLLGIRPEDQRDTFVAFAILAGMLAAHTMLETARDALFLEKLPPEQLPIAYLAIAGLGFFATKLNAKATARFSRRRLLSLTLFAGGVITACFFVLLESRNRYGLIALYVWTGLFATVLIVQFWLRLGDVFDVTQAKRLFSIIAAGGLVGATFGSGLASGLLELMDARALLLVSGGLFIVAGVLPRALRGAPRGEAPRRRAAKAPKAQRSTLSRVMRDSYLLRLFIMGLLAAVIFTGIDFAFKSSIVEEAARRQWDLGEVFARYYAVVNFLALLVQLFLAPRLLRVVGVNRALLIMPLLLMTGGLGLAVTAGTLPALLLKGVDGTMRHSVHRTASEILYLPLARPIRERFKGLAEAVGQRGGQALASVLILAASVLHADAFHIGLALVVLCALWTVTLIGLQPLYLDLFRKQLRDGMLQTEVDVPVLDLASFETLVSALSAEDDAEVIAALEMLDSYGKTDLVPALILYHPSRAVVTRAFELFARSRRTDVRRLTGRLLRHEDDAIRAAALRTLAVSDSDEQLLRTHLDDESPIVRCTAMVALIGAGFAKDDEAEEKLRAILSESETTQMALAECLRDLSHERFDWVVRELVAQKRPELTAAVARSLAHTPQVRFLPLLIDMLRTREARNDARLAMIVLGAPALEALTRALADRETPAQLRMHLPRTISRFTSQAAADVLVDALSEEKDKRVQFKILRGLGRMRAEHLDIEVDRDKVLACTKQTLEHAVTVLSWRLAVGNVVAHRKQGLTAAAELLTALLDEHEKAAIERVFRLLHIVEPTHQFRIIYDGLQSEDGKAKASSRELLSHLVTEELRDIVLVMVDDTGPRERLKQAVDFYDPPGRAALERALARMKQDENAPEPRAAFYAAYTRLLRSMLQDTSDALRSLVSYHVAELGLETLRPEIKSATASTSATLRDVARSALELLDLSPSPELSGAG